MNNRLRRIRLARGAGLLTFVLVIYFALAFTYNVAVPVFEAPDSYYHFAVIEHFKRTGQLPAPDDADEAKTQPWRQMAFHAPLYYLSSAALIAPINTDDFDTIHLNPHAAIGEPGADNNRNFLAHAGGTWHDTGLAVRVVRMFSTVLGGVTLIATYCLAHLAVPGCPRLALLAVVVVLFNPQFLFIHAAVTNDSLATALSTVILVLTVYGIRHGVELRYIVLLGMLLALNSLAKASGLLFFLPAGLGILYVTHRDRLGWWQLVIYGVVIVSAFVLIAGWWYWRSFQLYGDPTGATLVAEATQSRSGSIDVVGELRGLFYSFWGLFGWFNILSPQIFYDWVAIIVVVGAGGALASLWRRWSSFSRDDRAIMLISGVFAVFFINRWWWFNTQVEGAQGRLWFPLLGLVAIVLAAGWMQWSRRAVPVLLLLPMATVAAAAPWLIIRPVYQPSDQISRDAWNPPADAVSIPVRQPWEDEACLVLWIKAPVWDGESTQISIDHAWEARCAVGGYWSVFAHFSDIERESCQAGDTSHILRQYDTMPDGGKTPIPAISPGFVLEDRISVEVPSDLDWSRDWHIQFGLYDAGGTFIRAFFLLEDASGMQWAQDVFVGQCSPELINLRILDEIK